MVDIKSNDFPENNPAAENSGTFLSVKNLVVKYITSFSTINAVNDVSFTLNKGETLGLVGETGAGKTTIAKSILRILPDPPAKIYGGEILLYGEDLLKVRPERMREIRGNRISMIFQDPMTSLNPIEKIGDQIAESIKLHVRCPRKEIPERGKLILEKVGIQPERYNDYPHQLSGGMKQRVVIAMAMACNPEILLADEPTTALDVTIQAQVLEMIKELQREYETSVILITHDLGIVAEMCDSIAVIYAGEIVEYGTAADIFDRTSHPYTAGLFGSLPGRNKKARRLDPIKGLMPDPSNLPPGCKFHERCRFATDRCAKEMPENRRLSDTHYIKCFAESGVIR